MKLDCVIENITVPVSYQAPIMLEESNLSEIVCRELSLSCGPCDMSERVYNYGESLWEDLINERHRHRYEFNNDYRNNMENAGLIITGTSPDDSFL